MTKQITTELPAYNFNCDIADFLSTFSLPTSDAPVRPSLLHDLAKEGDVLSAEVVIESGGAPDPMDDVGRRPLHEAAFFGHAAMVGFLLDQGAAIDAEVRPFGHTPLYLAVQQKHHAVARELIRRGARLDARDKLLGTGLLHLAAADGDMQMAGLLIVAGVDVFRQNKKGMTARDVAAKHGHATLEKSLLKVMEHHAKYPVTED